MDELLRAIRSGQTIRFRTDRHKVILAGRDPDRDDFADEDDEPPTVATPDVSEGGGETPTFGFEDPAASDPGGAED